MRINSGDRFHADFIREYTQEQYTLRGGEESLAEGLNQESFNLMALNLANDIIHRSFG